jgi:SAM-dependent methyltransferase
MKEKPRENGGVPPENYEDQENILERRWNDLYDRKQPYRRKSAVELVTTSFEKYAGELKGEKILDIGCGNGRNLRHAAKLGHDSYGIEISEEAVNQLQEDFNEEGLSAKVKKGSFYDLPYEDGEFGCVMSINTFQFNDWKGAEKSFQEASRVLKNNGLFLLSIRSTSRDLPENRKDIPDKGITIMLGQGEKEGIKFHYFSEDEIRELADKNSLEILEIRDVVKKEKTNEGGVEKTIDAGKLRVVLRKKSDLEQAN